MKVHDLKTLISPELYKVLEKKVDELTPPQKQSIEKGLLLGKNLLIVSPTASGKTLIAEIGLINSILTRGGKGVYVAPMRALVREKFEEFSKDYPFVKIAMSIGDFDSYDFYLRDYDLIFVSTEKLDSLIRHGASWISDISCIVFDEIHMLDDVSRGPTLEILITKLRNINKKMQIIGLSATIGKPEELAKWLDAELIESDFRLVKLYKGIYHEGNIYFLDKVEKVGETSNEEDILKYVLNKSKQLLIFYSSKRNAEAAAKRLSKITMSFLSEEEKLELKKISGNVLSSLSNPTKQCKDLSSLIEKGIAFHHAGLMNSQRTEVEEAFKKGYIKCICSTTTLGLGVNLPANTVLVANLSRYGEEDGVQNLKKREVLQLLGRAGRPQYDSFGLGLILCKKEKDIQVFGKYLYGEPEEIYSKLGYMSVLRTHVLSLICDNFDTEDKILDFFSQTFFGFQYGNVLHLYQLIREVLDDLEEWGFVKRTKEHIFATKLGLRVNELYIDPLSAKLMLDSMERESLEPLRILFSCTYVVEMMPFFKAKDRDLALNAFVEYEDFFPKDFELDDPLKIAATVNAFKEWISEIPENELLEKYNTTPGSFFGKLTILDWMLYSYAELLKIKNKPTREAVNLRARVLYGVREELLDLVSISGIGRVRARKIYNLGIKNKKDFLKALNDKTLRKKLELSIGSGVLKKIEESLLNNCSNK